MPTIDEMQVVINAKTEGMRAELAKAAQSVKEFAAGSKEQIAGMIGLFGKLNGAGGDPTKMLGLIGNAHPALGALSIVSEQMVKLTKFREENLKWAGDLLKLSASSGMVTERLQEFGHAADLARVPQEALAKGLNTFKVNADLAAGGMGPLVAVLKDYGVQMKWADGTMKSFDQLLYELVAAMGRAEGDTEKARIALAAFGDAGKELLPIFGQGTKALDEFADKARTAGKVSSDAFVMAVGLIDNEWEKWIGNMRRRYAEFKNMVHGMSGQAIAATAGEQWVPTSMLESQSREIQRQIKETQAAIDTAKAELLSGSGERGYVDAFWTALAGNMPSPSAEKEVTDNVAKLEALQARLGVVQEKILERMGPYAGPIDTPENTTRPAPPKPEPVAAVGGRGGRDNTPSLTEYLERQIRQNKSYGEGLGKTAGEVAALRAEEEILARAKHHDIEITAELRAELDRLKGKLVETVDAAESWKRQLQVIQDVGRAVSSNLERAFSDFTRTGKVNFKEMTASILHDLAMIAFRTAVIGPLFGTGGNNQGVFGTALAGMLGSFGGARARGGGVAAGSTYLVGEEGPELLHMGGSGVVIPADATKRLMAQEQARAQQAMAGGALDVRVAAGPELLVTIDQRARQAVSSAAPQIAAAAVRTTERALPGMLRSAQQRKM